jgi:hypothetical protein
MAVAFRSAGTLTKTNTGAAGLNVPYPAGLAANDLLVLQASVGTSSSATINTPSGWTKLFGPVTGSGASGQAQYVFTKVASGSETGNLSLVATANNQLSGIMAAYTGCDTTTPVDVFATASLATSGTTGTAPSVTTTKASTLILHMYWDWSGSGTTTPNAADTERYDTFDTNQNYITELADTPQAAAGASGTSTVTFSTGMSGGLAATIALAPVAVSTPPVADFTGTPTSGTATLAVTFTDASTNTPTSWAWDFGDGGTSTSQNPTHNYTTGGTYTVALTATNTAGSNTKTRTAYITVGETIAYVTGGGITVY